jgi:hypothetical protein
LARSGLEKDIPFRRKIDDAGCGKTDTKGRG